MAIDGIFTPGKRPIMLGNDGGRQFILDTYGNITLIPTGSIVSILGEAYINGFEVAVNGLTVTEIASLADFDPSGGIIPVPTGHYQFKDTIDIGTNRFVFEDGATVLFEFDDSFNNWIEHSGNNMTLFSGTATFRCLGGKGNAFIINGDNVQFIDITGSLGLNFGFIGFYGTGASLGTVRGRVVNQTATAGLLINNSVVDGWEDGFTVINANETGIRDLGGTASPSATGTLLSVQGLSNSVIARGSYISMPAAASLFDIDPTVTINASIDRFFLTDSGNFFKPSVKSGSFTAVADASIGATNITGVSASGGSARFSFAAGPTVYVGQAVTISGFTTNTDYNGTYFISATDGTTYFDVDAINFGTTETGSFLSNSVTLTEVGTTAADGDSILIDTTNSTAYDVGSFVYNKQTDSFQISATWTATATGTWHNGSQTEDSKYVTVKNCGDQKDSRSLSAVYVTGNTATTTATGNTWVDLDLGTALESGAASRFKLIDPVTGEIEYTGVNPFDGVVSVAISAFKGAAVNQLHQFRVFKSFGSPAFEDILSEADLINRLRAVPVVIPVSLLPGDRFKVQVKAVGATTTVTIQNITIAAV